MSLARAFTARRAKQSIDASNESSFPQRSNTSSRRHGYSGSIRDKISAPTELTHTTNMLAYNAPDLYPKSASSTTSSRTSEDDSDGHRTAASSPPSSPDVETVDERSTSPQPNHLSCYFTAPGQQLPVIAKNEAPKIPQRAPSHTKKASYENFARQQSLRQSNHSSTSVSTKASFSLSRSSSSSTSTSVSSVSYRGKPLVPAVPDVPTTLAEEPAASPLPSRSLSQRRTDATANHPFGQELAQVSEIAEDFGVKDRLAVIDEEEQDLLRKGLCLFKAEDYLADVQGLFSTFFNVEQSHARAQPIWI